MRSAIKKIGVTAAAATSLAGVMLATPTTAQAGYYGYGNGPGWVGPAVVGGLIGALTTSHYGYSTCGCGYSAYPAYDYGYPAYDYGYPMYNYGPPVSHYGYRGYGYRGYGYRGYGFRGYGFRGYGYRGYRHSYR